MTFEAVWPEHYLPHRPLSGDVKDPEHPSLRRRSRPQAFGYPHIEANPFALRSLVMVDHDGGEAEWAAELAGLPAPSWVSLNPHTGSGHIEYALRDPVCLTDAARRGPVNLLARIEHAMVTVLGGDVAYGGRIMKNPHHDTHTTLWGPQEAVYGLRDLARALDDLGALPGAGSPRHNVQSSAIGRNVALFDTTRKWSYRRRGDHTSLNTWEQAVFAHAWTTNETIIANDFTTGPLTANEVTHIARSIARWTWRKIQRSFTQEQTRRGQLGGIASGKIMTDAKRKANRQRRLKFDYALYVEADRER